MTIASNPKDTWIAIIDEYLAAARLSIDKTKADGGLLGYPATLLLFCVIDSIGHAKPSAALSPRPKNPSTRLDVLIDPDFFNIPALNDAKVENLRCWYRNALVHTGALPANVFLAPESHGQPFEFDDADALTLIRVPVLYSLVHNAWIALDKTRLEPGSVRAKKLPDVAAQKEGFISALSPAASGLVTLPGAARRRHE